MHACVRARVYTCTQPHPGPTARQPRQGKRTAIKRWRVRVQDKRNKVGRQPQNEVRVYELHPHASVRSLPELVGGRHVLGARHERPDVFAEDAFAADRDRIERSAVKAIPITDGFVPTGGHSGQLQRDADLREIRSAAGQGKSKTFRYYGKAGTEMSSRNSVRTEERERYRCSSAGREENSRKVAPCVSDELLGEVDRRLVRVAPRRKGQARIELPLDRVDHILIPKTDLR